MNVITVVIEEFIQFDATPDNAEQKSAQLQIKLYEDTKDLLLQLFNVETPELLMEVISPYIINYVMNRPKVHMMVGYTFEVTYEFLEGVAVALSMVMAND